MQYNTYLDIHPEVAEALAAGKTFTLASFDEMDPDDIIGTPYACGAISPLTEEEKRAFLDSRTGVALGSDAFFPFPDSIKRAKASGVSYVAEPGGSIRDDLVIAECDKNGMVMAFTGMRLFHH